MVQNFQTLPEIGRAGLKVGTIQKSTKSVQKHGPANKKEAWGPLLVPSEIVGPHTPGTTPGLPYNPTTGRRSYHRRRGRLTRQFGWQFASASRQFGIGSAHRHFCCSVHSPNRGTLPLGPRQFGWQFARGTRQFGNMFSAIRLLGACPKCGVYRSFGRQFGWQFASNSRQFGTVFRQFGCSAHAQKRRKFGNSLPTQFPF